MVLRAKVIINLHVYDTGVLEELRIVPVLATGCVVVSEKGVDTVTNKVYEDHVIFVDKPEQLFEACTRALVTKPSTSWIKTRSMESLMPWDVIEQDWHLSRNSSELICKPVVVKKEPVVTKKEPVVTKKEPAS
jgi:hypothetical protein